MNTKEIESMQAGREMDMLIAEKIFGIVPKKWDKDFDPLASLSSDIEWPSCYSTDIADAWKVVEKLREQRFSVLIDEGADYAWSCYLEGRGFQSGNAEAHTAPLAICRAALIAVSQEEK